MHSKPRDHSLRHPAVGAALSARNAVAAEMAVAGRAANSHLDAAWALAADHALRGTDPAGGPLTGGVFTSDAPTGHALMGYSPTSHALAVPLRPGAAPPEAAAIRKPAARRRRELLEMCVWFAVGGLGGLLVLAAVRVMESLLR